MDLTLWCDDWHLYGRGISLRVGACVALPVRPMDADRVDSVLGPDREQEVLWQVELHGDGRGDLAVVSGRLGAILQVDHAVTVRSRGGVALLEPNPDSTVLIALSAAPPPTLEPLTRSWEDGDLLRADTALLLRIEGAAVARLDD